MANTDPVRATRPDTPAGERLDSWKEIAAYLKRDVRTVHRWEHTEGLPVHRHAHQKRGSVYAFKAELDQWWNNGHTHLVPATSPWSAWKSAPRSIFLVLSGLLVLAAGMLLLTPALRHRLWGTPASLGIQSIAVLPLANVSGDPGQEYFADGMTEELITQLGKSSGLRVISHTSAHYLVATGQFAPALQESLVYLQLDPLSPAANTHLAMHYDMARQFDLAVQQARKAVELDPNFPDAHGELTWAYLGSGRPKDAVPAAQQAVNVSKNKAVYLRNLGRAYAAAGMRPEAAKVLAQIHELSQRRFVEAMPMAIIHIGLGNNDEALRLLEKAEREHDHDILYLKVFHLFDPLRPDPRFQALVNRMHFPE